MKVVGFIPPVVGVEGEFNTFRLGGFYAKNLNVGDVVGLLDEKRKVVFGTAKVQRIEVGRLEEMCQAHAASNHTEIAQGASPELSPGRLMTLLTRIYGPHIVTPTKKTTVIFMERLE